MVGIAIFLRANGEFYGISSLAVMGALAVIVTVAPRLGADSRLAKIIDEGQHSTSQTTLRWTIVLLIGLLVIASRFGLDVVLGAFLAGVVLNQWAPGDVGAGGQARRYRLRVLHPDLLHLLGDEPRP